MPEQNESRRRLLDARSGPVGPAPGSIGGRMAGTRTRIRPGGDPGGLHRTALNLQTSFLTPPMAMSACYLKGIAPPHVRLTQIFRGCFPFLGMVFIAMAIMYVFPDIVFWLPDLVYGR
jgi:hypothetical protein